MDDFTCEICLQDYQSSVTIPRVLECGHSICSNCLETLMTSTKTCPKCRSPFQRSTVEDYPVNYTLLGVIDSLSKSTDIDEIKRKLQALEIKYMAVETKLSDVQSQLDINSDIVRVGLEKIRDLLNGGTELLADETNMKRTIGELSKNLNKLMRDENNRPRYFDIISSSSLDFSNYTHDNFITEIYKKIVEGGDFYAVTEIENEVKFAKLTVWSDKILVHAFGPSNDKASNQLVLFKDLKKCMYKIVSPFLEICDEIGRRQIIIIRSVCSSLVPPFLHYCTGESGPLYKGAQFYGEEKSNNYSKYGDNFSGVKIMEVNDFQGKNVNGTEYASTLGPKVQYYSEQIVCLGNNEGIFDIVRLRCADSLKSVIGIIEEPSKLNISHGSNCRIIDSGLIIDVYPSQ